MQKRLLFTIGYICKIPWGGGGMAIWPALYTFITFILNRDIYVQIKTVIKRKTKRIETSIGNV